MHTGCFPTEREGINMACYVQMLKKLMCTLREVPNVEGCHSST
jgi:hypothetical protein